MSNIQKIKNKIINFLFPTTCIVCAIGEKIICDKCFSNIPIVPKDKINILSVYEYKNKIVNKLLWKLKYQHSGDVADFFAKSVAQELEKWLIDFQENFQNGLQIILIPAPLNKFDKRIHNHAELLARAISKHFPNSQVISNLLEKNSPIKQAHTKNKHERMGNIENTIAISQKLPRLFYSISVLSPLRGDSQSLKNTCETLKREIQNKLIIIVDDVTTTGSTICNIRNVLANFLEIPEGHILAVTIAH